MKKFFMTSLVAVVCSVMMSIGATASGTDLDDIGTALPDTSVSQSVENTNTPDNEPADTQANPSNTGTTLGNAYSDLGLSSEDLENAKQIISPGVKIANTVIGVLVAVLGTILLAITALDLIYIVSPSFVRGIGSNSQGGGFASLISDDCKAALAESGAAMPPAGNAPGGMNSPMGMGSPMGMSPMGMSPMGMSPMGMSPMGGPMGGQAPAKPKAKTVALCYLKKRAFTLVLIGVCAVVLTCTCFLDVGTTIGQWIVDFASGIGK